MQTLALYEVLHPRAAETGAAPSPTRPGTTGPSRPAFGGWTSPAERARFARGMASRGSTEAGMRWFLEEED